MPTNSGSRELFGIVVCVIAILVAFFTALILRDGGDPMARIALKEKRIAVVNSMRLSLAAASEAQNSSILSTGDQDSKTFGEEARAATAELERGRVELEQLLKQHRDSNEIALMERVTQSLQDFRKIDDQLLDLSSQSSNRKAYGLAFGPAMTLLKELDEPLSQLVEEAARLAAGDAVAAVRMASEARVAILRIQVLLLPHIAEASDQKMDELEGEIAAADQLVRKNLSALSETLPAAEKSKLESVKSRYAEFENLKNQIIKLSRQNTNLLAAAIALKEKRKAMLACQDALVDLEQAIRSEQVSKTIPTGRSAQ